MQSILKISGHFKCRVIDIVTGKVVHEIDEPNLVVDTGKQVVAKALGNLGAYGAKIGVGTGTTAAAAGDTGLTGAFIKALTGTAVNATNTIQFSYDITSSEANGMTIGEFGLFDNSGTPVLIARKVLSSTIAKTSSFALQGTWTITVN
jgi:hypothetical protein